MPAPYTPVAADLPVSVTLPTAGDLEDASTVTSPFAVVLDHAKWVQDQLSGGTGGVDLYQPVLEAPTVASGTFDSPEITGNATSTAVFALTGAGHFLNRPVSLSDADATVSITDGDLFEVPSTSTLTANRNITIANSVKGAGLHFVNRDATYNLVLHNAGGGIIKTLLPRTFGMLYYPQNVVDGWKISATGDI